MPSAKRLYELIEKEKTSLSGDGSLIKDPKKIKIGDTPTALSIGTDKVHMENISVGGTSTLGGKTTLHDSFYMYASGGDFDIDVKEAVIKTASITVKDEDGGASMVFDTSAPYFSLSEHASVNSFLYDGHYARLGSHPISGNTSALMLSNPSNAADYLTLSVTSNGAATLSTVDEGGGTAGSITINPSGDLFIDVTNGICKFYNPNITKYGGIGVADGGTTTLSTVDGSGGTTDADLVLDIDGDITLDSASGVFIAKNNGTEFSAANSSYAGMILGYTCLGHDDAAATYNLTTSYAVPADKFNVAFVAPPSGKVEIEIQTGMTVGGSNLADLYAGLSTANATSGYSALASFHESELFDAMSRGALRVIRHSWTLIGLTAGTSYQYWVGFKSTSTAGTPQIQYGGDASNEYPDFIMKATALPATIAT